MGPMTPLATTFSYGEVEEALARVHRIPRELRGSFKARIQHFQRLGMVPQSPGKGKRIAYELADVYRWAVGLEFVEFGIDPTAIKAFLETNWSRIQTDMDADMLLVFHPCYLSRSIPEEGALYRPVPPGTLAMQAVAVKDLSELDQLPLEREFKARYGLIDLGRLKRKVDAALAA
jgi:hypothetical protein